MGCGASSASKKAAAGDLTTAPAPEAAKEEATKPGELKTTKNDEDSPTREPSEQAEAKQGEAAAAQNSPNEAESKKQAEDLKAWSAELGEGGDAAATKLQAKCRGKQARAEVEKIKESKAAKGADTDATKTETKEAGFGEAPKEAGSGEAPKEEAPPKTEESKEEAPVQEATPEEMENAATKVQSLQRGKQARAEVEKMKTAKLEAGEGEAKAEETAEAKKEE